MAMFQQLKPAGKPEFDILIKWWTKNGFRIKSMASKWADSIKDQYKAGGDLEKRKVSLLDYFWMGLNISGTEAIC